MNQEIIKFYQTNKIYLFPIIVGISSLILIIFIIYPQTVALLANQQVEKVVSNNSELLTNKVNALEQYDNIDLNQKVDSALGFYPTDKEVVPVVGLLQNLASKAGFSTISMSLGGISGKSDNKSQSYTIKLELSGPSQLLQSLLSNIENSQRLMRVNSVELTSGSDPRGAEVTLIVEVLYASPPSDLGGVDSPLPQLSQTDQEIINKLTLIVPSRSTQQISTLGTKGKANPFE